MKFALPILVLVTSALAQDPLDLWGQPNPGAPAYKKWCPALLVYDIGVDGGHKFTYDAWCYPDGAISDATGVFFSIVLDECLANSGGAVKWRKDDHLSSSCFEYHLQADYELKPSQGNSTTTEWMQCSCPMPKGTTMMSSIDLFKGLVYDQGTLRCANRGW